MPGSSTSPGSAVGASSHDDQDGSDQAIAHRDGESDDGEAHSHHRVRQRNEGSNTSIGPLDLLPWAASPFDQWRRRKLVNRTPQHLETLQTPALSPVGAWSAPPVLVDGHFLVMATTDGYICVWPARVLAGKVAGRGANPDKDTTTSTTPSSTSTTAASFGADNSSSRDDPVVPGSIVDTKTAPGTRRDHQSSLVQLAVAPKGVRLVPELSAAGQSKVSDSPPTPTKSKIATETSHEKIGTSTIDYQLVAISVQGDVYVVDIDSFGIVTLAFSFHTGRCGITCATVNENAQIIIGYQLGYVEAWALSLNVNSNSKSKEESVMPKLAWRASFSSHSPIRSVAPLKTSLEDDQPTSEQSPVITANSPNEYLAVTLQPETRRSSASLLEVVDLSSVADAWDKMGNPTAAAAAVPLEEHWVLPDAGMELIDADTLSLPSESGSDGCGSHATSNWIPSSGTDCLMPLPQQNGSLSVAVGLSDGTLGIVSASVSSLHGMLSWGIAAPANQVLFPYPCIGLGQVNLTSNRTPLQPSHVAYCMRGSTTYLVPADTEEDDPPVTVLSYPDDVDSDTGGLQQAVQGFTAGNLRLSNTALKAGESSTLPVLVYAWPGGIVDVYSCELLNPDNDSGQRFRPVLLELLENGSAKLLHRFLTMRGIETFHNRPDWMAAWNEITAFSKRDEGLDDEKLLTISQLCSPELVSFRNLLLQLADVEGQIELLI